MQAEKLQNSLGVGEQLFQLLFRSFRGGEFDQLDLVELVLPDQSTGVAAMTSGFGAETGCIGGVKASSFTFRFASTETIDSNALSRFLSNSYRPLRSRLWASSISSASL